MLPVLLVLLGAAPTDAAAARLQQQLQPEVAAGWAAVGVSGPAVVVRLVGDPVFDLLDPLWKCLGAVAREARRPGGPPLRVELSRQQSSGCERRTEVVRHYLFGKQRLDQARISVTCGAPWTPAAARAEPPALTVVGLTVEARRFTVGEYRPLTGVAVHARNGTDAGIALEVEGVELLQPGLERSAELLGLWSQPAGGSAIVARKDGQGPTRLVVEPGPEVMIMLQFEPALDDRLTSGRRVRFTAGGQAGAVVGPVVRLGFSEGAVDGRLP